MRIKNALSSQMPGVQRGGRQVVQGLSFHPLNTHVGGPILTICHRPREGPSDLLPVSRRLPIESPPRHSSTAMSFMDTHNNCSKPRITHFVLRSIKATKDVVNAVTISLGAMRPGTSTSLLCYLSQTRHRLTQTGSM